MSWIVSMLTFPLGINDLHVTARQLGAQATLWAHHEHLNHPLSGD
jgi:hypothetical protein